MPSPFLIITGLSGSGKRTFLHALEDSGYFCVDNLPVGLLGKFHELFVKSHDETTRVALVIDIREGRALDEVPQALAELRANSPMPPTLVFLEATDESLVRRFSETRRPHPVKKGKSVLDSIAQERQRLAPIRAMADTIVDTSRFTIHELRSYATSIFGETRSGERLVVSVVSFGYKFGIPIDSDLVFDVRFLPNPHFVPGLKRFSGEDSEVVEYMNSHQTTRDFVDRMNGLLTFLLPQYEKEGKAYLTIAIGCTGGRHRSVMIANAIADHLKVEDYRVKVFHRDVDKV